MTQSLSARLAELLNPPAGIVGLAATHLESGRTWRHHERVVMPSASVIKLPILATFWKEVEAGRIDPAERVTVPADAYVDGTGVLKALAPGLRPTWRDLATLMITVSDNTATNLIVDRLGLAAVQAWVDEAGLADTRIQRRMMDRAAMEAGRQNLTSAADMERLLLAVAAGTCVSADASSLMRRMLDFQQVQDRLPQCLDRDVRIGNKTGNFTDVVHDVGIAAWPGGTLVIAVLTKDVQPAWRATRTIADIAAVLVDSLRASA